MQKSRKRSDKGASIIETALGLTFLIPLVLLIVDVGALVISQTSNDAMAKHAAREAAAQYAAPGQTLPPSMRQAAAQSVVSACNPTSLADNPTLVAYSEPQAGQICQVKTQVLCNLPVAVPFGGPSTQLMQSMAVEPITSTRAVVSSNAPPLTGQSNNNVAPDEGYLNMKSLTGGKDSPITEIGGAVVVPE